MKPYSAEVCKASDAAPAFRQAGIHWPPHQSLLRLVETTGFLRKNRTTLLQISHGFGLLAGFVATGVVLAGGAA
jgi:hypothetical protein